MPKSKEQKEKERKEKEKEDLSEEQKAHGDSIFAIKNGLEVKIHESEKVLAEINDVRMKLAKEGLSFSEKGEEDPKALDAEIGEAAANRESLIQEWAKLLIKNAKENEPDDDDDENENDDENGYNDGGSRGIRFNSLEDLEKFSDEMEKAHRDLDIPQFTEKTETRGGGHTYYSHLPKACKGKDVFEMDSEGLAELRKEIEVEMRDKNSKFSKEFAERYPDRYEEKYGRVRGPHSEIVVKHEEEKRVKKNNQR